MRLLVTGDLHFSDAPRDGYRHEFVPWFLKQIEKHHIDVVIIVGDLTEEKDRHSARLVNRVVEHIAAIAELCHVIILRGNHDYVELDNPFYAFTRLLGAPGRVRWVNGPEESATDAGDPLKLLGRCLFLPHTHDYQRDWGHLRLRRYDWVFAHNTFVGADLGHGQKATRGPPVSLFGQDAFVISGDVHIPQALGVVTYVGAPYTVDFGDDYRGRILLIDIDKGLQPIFYDGPQKRLFEIRKVSDLRRFAPTAGDILKVRMRLTHEDYPNWQERQREVLAWGRDCGCVVHTVEVVLDERRSTTAEEPSGKKAKKQSSMSRSDEQLVKDYAKLRALDERTTNVGLNLLRRG